MTPSPDADVPAASVTLGMVGLAVFGGLACALAIAWGSTFATAVKASPLYLAWSTLVTAEGVVAWSGFLPAMWTALRLWPKVERSARQRLAWSIGAVLTVLIAYFGIVPFAYPLTVVWPLGPEHSIRVGIISFVVLIPTVFAVFAMWLATARADQLTRKVELVPREISDYLALRGAVQGFLWFLGTVIGLAVLATGMLRQSMLAGAGAIEKNYPAPLVLAYGAFFTIVLTLCYVPVHALMMRAGQRIQRGFLQRISDVSAWSEERKKLAELLGLELSVDKSLKDTIAILAPLVAGFVSNALPGVGGK